MTSLLRFTLLYALMASAQAYEFHHFSLNPARIKTKNFTGLPTQNILFELEDYFRQNKDRIGNELTRDLIENHDLGGGIKNFSGFSWYMPMLNYDLDADRNLAPDLMSNRWIVQDSLTISIEAATLLKHLDETQLISITPKQLEAFAGLTFKRTYYHSHFASSYLKGLTSDFSKLFLTFLAYRPEALFKLAPEEVLKREDIFTFNAGGKVEAPIGNGFELRAGVLVSYAFKNKIQIQSLLPTSTERIRLSVEKEINQKAQSQLSLQYDFFNILKMTLLSSELEYSYTQSKKMYLGLLSQDVRSLKQPQAYRELQQQLRGRQKLDYWLKRVTTFEDRVKQDLGSRYNFLLFGKMRKKATEQVNVVKNGLKKVFYKHYSYSKSYVQGLLSGLFSEVVQNLFDFDSAVTEKSHSEQRIEIEYEKEEEINKISKHKPFSFKISHSFFAQKTKKWYHRRSRNFMSQKVKGWMPSSEHFASLIKAREIYGPIRLTSIIELNQNNFKHLTQKNFEEILTYNLELCSIKKRDQQPYFDRKQRKRLFRSRRMNSKQRCARTLIRAYELFNASSEKHLQLDKLKTYLSYALRRMKSYRQLEPLLGEVFIHGSLSAQAKRGKLTQFFNQGEFTGIGVIDSFKNSQIVIPIPSNE